MIKSGNRVPRYKNTYLCTYVRMRYLNSGDRVFGRRPSSVVANLFIRDSGPTQHHFMALQRTEALSY